MLSISTLLVITLSVLSSSAYHFGSPTQTVPAHDVLDAQGWSPKPTEKPSAHEILKRQLGQTPTSVCGNKDGNSLFPYACDEGAYCGVASELGAYGCCSSYYSTTSSDSTFYNLVNCSWLGTACFDYGSTAGYVDNGLNLWCGDQNYAYCVTYTSIGANQSILDCTTTPSLVLSLSNPVVSTQMPLILSSAVESYQSSWESYYASYYTNMSTVLSNVTSSSSSRAFGQLNSSSFTGSASSTIPLPFTSSQPSMGLTSTVSSHQSADPTSSTSHSAPASASSSSSAVGSTVNSGLWKVRMACGLVWAMATLLQV